MERLKLSGLQMSETRFDLIGVDSLKLGLMRSGFRQKKNPANCEPNLPEVLHLRHTQRPTKAAIKEGWSKQGVGRYG